MKRGKDARLRGEIYNWRKSARQQGKKDRQQVDFMTVALGILSHTAALQTHTLLLIAAAVCEGFIKASL